MNKVIISIIAIIIASGLFAERSSAYWIWTPESKKFINPKYAVKDSPKEQFDWAMSSYNAKDYKKAVAEFEKLVKHYEYSEYASRAQYYVGLSYENMEKDYMAYQNYQKAIDNFPHTENLDEIIEREYNIANLYLAKAGPRLLGIDIMTSLDRAVEIYKSVVDNAPYGKYAAEAQFKMGEALKGQERYDEAIEAYQKVVDDHPDSNLFEKAKYEVAYCAYRASLKSEYASEPTEKAIRAFEEFAEANKASDLAKEADATIQRLKAKTARKAYSTGRFYEDRKQYDSAIIYYKEIVEEYPESSFVGEAKARIELLEYKRSRR